jgi:hypothetical protein
MAVLGQGCCRRVGWAVRHGRASTPSGTFQVRPCRTISAILAAPWTSCSTHRYDHAHCTKDLVAELTDCTYDHEPRLTRLSDHSALTVRLTRTGTDPLLTSDPVEATSPPTLF